MKIKPFTATRNLVLGREVIIVRVVCKLTTIERNTVTMIAQLVTILFRFVF